MGWQDSVSDSEVDAEDSDFDLSEVAPSAMSRDEAIDKPKTDTVLIWADPGDGKTHYGYTMPDPVCVVDTEGKAHEIAHKFDGLTDDDPFIWHVEDYDEALAAVREALDVLNAFKDEFGVRGTLMVDSMSKMWDWSKTKYKDEKYPNTPNEEVEISFDSGIAVWNDIKEYHNEDFRSLMLNTGFNVCWTARRKEDVKKSIEEDPDYKPYKPEGEKGNAYEANTVLHVHRNNPEGVPQAVLEKEGAIKNRYAGLDYPTHEKHREVVEAIEEVELEGGDISEVEEEFGVSVFEGEPKYEES